MIRLDRLITLAIFGPLAGLTNSRGIRIPILMYHSISRDEEHEIHPYYRVVTTPEVFSQHMALLAAWGHQVIGLDEAITLLRQGKDVTQHMPSKPVVLTFDDGFLDFYTDAFPILERCGFTATVFLPTSFIDAVGRTSLGKSFLSWPQVRELANKGITLGSHTVSHGYMAGMTHAAVEKELRQSKDTIEERTGMPVRSFSYPYAFPEEDNNFVALLRSVLQDCGYTCGVSTIIGTSVQGDDPFTLKRLPVNASDDPALLIAKMRGSYDWMHTAQYAAKSARSLFGIRRKMSFGE
jgi:peptidoglycan/xylan/chitin deacetylase (PgdA/CDA1 family)